MDHAALCSLLDRLSSLPSETEWVEFKVNYANAEEVGEYCSALSNSARLLDQSSGYLVFGVENDTHRPVGTEVTLNQLKVGNEEFQNWLANRLRPSINIEFFTLNRDGRNFLILKIHPAVGSPVQFSNVAYVRVGSAKRPLNSMPEKERILWQKCSGVTFEKGIAASNVTANELFDLIDIDAYFELLKIPRDADRETIISRLESEQLLIREDDGSFNITNLGAILLANNLDSFSSLRRPGVRVITYDGRGRLSALGEAEGKAGYANGFVNLISHIQSQLPQWEVIKGASRTTKTEYPEVAIREFVANALIHQDFMVGGSGPMVEIFDDRIEISNPGVPLVDRLRLMDNSPISRNDALASFMRRAGFCEERGSGIDRAIFHIEASQLPAPDFVITETHMRVVLYGPKTFAEMVHQERVSACYWHCCLKHLSGEKMTNQSLRNRLGVAKRNYPMISQVIAESKDEGLIKDHDPLNKAPRYAKYVPFWV